MLAEKTATENDRRANRRTELEVEVGLESDHNFYTGLTQDISSGGLFVATHDIRPVGDKLTVKFKLPGSNEPIEAETEVRWVRDYRAANRDAPEGMGLRFLGLSAEAEAAISVFLRDRDSLYYDE